MTFQGNLRGTRHLRLGVRLEADSATLVSIGLVGSAVLQRTSLLKPIRAEVAIGGQVALTQALPDARLARGGLGPGLGHAYRPRAAGLVHVAVPFTSPSDLDVVRVLISDASRGGAQLGALTSADLQAHPDWPRVWGSLAEPQDAGSFEIYLDRAGEFRWRLRAGGGNIVADSGEGYRTLAECEADLAWIRSHAATVVVINRQQAGEGAAGPTQSGSLPPD